MRRLIGMPRLFVEQLVAGVLYGVLLAGMAASVIYVVAVAGGAL